MKRLFITGICRGIGRAIAEQLYQQGYEIYGIHSPDCDLADDLKDHKSYHIYSCDLGDYEQIDVVLKEIKGIKFDTIVQNAGIFKEEDISSFDPVEMERTFRINTLAPIYLIGRLSPMIKSGGSVVMISSTDAQVGGYASLSYAASKAAIDSAVKTLAVQLGPNGIRVNAVAPGWVDTDMGSESGGVSNEAIDKTPLGRNSKPQEIASVVSFLISDLASFVTGITMNVDGGYMQVDEVLKREAGNLKLLVS